jgi:phosphoribosylformylglycinamidine (FGAM) synthase PurS component
MVKDTSDYLAMKKRAIIGGESSRIDRNKLRAPNSHSLYVQGEHAIIKEFLPGCNDGITGLSYNINDCNPYKFTVIWNTVPGVASYTVTSSDSSGVITITSDSSAEFLYANYDCNAANQIVTVTANKSCGKLTSASIEVQPCFLAGSLVHMADGTSKVIENVRVDDLVIGAFGEINRVLALHRPLLGTAKMCKINNEHSTTNHHPHISSDKKFYCGNPDLVSSSTYGHKHNVIDADGNIVERMLHGLKKERIEKLDTGIHLKTIEGSRVVTSIDLYSMPEDTQLYNLVIDGSHTYHVDGYAVTGWPSEHDFDYDNWCVKQTA